MCVQLSCAFGGVGDSGAGTAMKCRSILYGHQQSNEGRQHDENATSQRPKPNWFAKPVGYKPVQVCSKGRVGQTDK